MRLRGFAAAGALAYAAFTQCHGAGGREQVADEARGETDAMQGDADTSAAQVGPTLWVPLDDARFRDARTLEDDAHHVEAAAALEAALPKTTSKRERCEVSYVIGRLRALGGDDAGAATAFDDAASDASCPLWAYARARAAASYERASKPEDAIARASDVGSDVAISEEALLVRAEALAAKGDRAQAVPIWRTHLSQHPRGLRWVDTAARLAAALLDGIDGDPKSRAREAFDLATRVVVEAPTFDDSSGASTLRTRALALDASLPRDLTADEHLRRAHALVDAGHPDKARTEAVAALAALPAKDRAASEMACKIGQVRAQAIAKMPSSRRPAIADAWGETIRACAKETDALATALYAGAKASSAAQRPDEALERYGRIEHEQPKHRLADDARLASATILQARDAARAEAMLLALPDDYPEGDMRGEALFHVALDRMARADWEGAKAPLDRALEIEGTGHPGITSGRLAYFRAKCSAKTGDTADAKRRWVDLLHEHPIGYYMAQASRRLTETDATLARTTLDALTAAEPAGAFVTHEHPELGTPSFLRGVALLEVGETDYARREISASGAIDDHADPELVWLVASLFDRAHAPDVGQSFARGRLSDYLTHYPAGRWVFAWQTAYPRAFEEDVVKGAADAHVPTPLVWGVMREESAFIADVRSAANAHGLMQLLPSTARELARGTSMPSDELALHQPRVSIALGSKFLGQLRATLKDDPSLAIAAYNAGLGAVEAWLRARPHADYDLWVEQIPFDETRAYLKRVLASELVYATIYAPETAKEVLELPDAVSPP